MAINTLTGLPIKILARGKLSVFLFHKIPLQADPLMPDDLDLPAFECLLDTVISSFQVISLDDAVVGLANSRLPPRAACITFDDGYESWVSGAVAALERRNLHATFFITTGQFEGRPLWHERIAHAVRHMTANVLDIDHPALQPLPLGNMTQRHGAVVKLEQFLKYFTLPAREDLLLRLESIAGVSMEKVPRLSLEDLRTIHNRGFGIGAHTDNHPILVYCDEDGARQEIGQVRETLGGHVGAPITTFAYPNGRPYADFSYKHVEMVKRAGYLSAVTTQWGVGDVGTSVFQIPRFTPWGSDPMSIAWQLGRNLLTHPDCVDESV
jgi:peptidoglycan/xylan/chitin deacetylase (PgdA/CDA1 family)